MLLGKLVTTSNRPVIVNGGEAITGAVILSGAQAQTSAASVATVQLDNVGSVMIAPSSNVTLAFDAKNVTVKVASGNATLTTLEGVKGVVLDSNGNPMIPTPSASAGGNTAKNWGIAGVAVGSAALIWAIISWNRANDAQDSLAALWTCLAGQTSSPVKLCTSF